MPFLSADAQENGLRSYLVMAAYLVAGSRMALGGAVFFFTGRLQTEFPRYLYLRRTWAEIGITDESRDVIIPMLNFGLNIKSLICLTS
jgi:hypothetical protein